VGEENVLLLPTDLSLNGELHTLNEGWRVQKEVNTACAELEVGGTELLPQESYSFSHKQDFGWRLRVVLRT
jgi:hypothetical protein